jgi:segregation and condensation protein A
MPYSLNLDFYKGPLEKLLELIQEKKMEISVVSMAEVTGDFLAFVQKIQNSEAFAEDIAKKEGLSSEETAGIPPETREDLKLILADFLVVASRLVLIKSKALIPALPLDDEDEADIRDLEARLKIYEEIKGAKSAILEAWRSSPVMLSREFLMTKEPFFFPPKNVGAGDLLKCFKTILGEFEKTLIPVKKIAAQVFNLQSKIEEVLQKITNEPRALHYFHENKNKSELVVLFLAILHLAKVQLIHIEQNEHLGEIRISMGEAA